MKRVIYLCFLIGALPSSQSTFAGSLMDYLRKYDLNDYAFGVNISTSQSPYVGGENSVFAYPYLTSFREASFTDDWLVASEGDLGVRWVNEAGWELGLVGRIQTLGFGNSDAPELRGMADREWTVEIAPMIGWRAWPVHVKFKAYAEVLGKHDGWISDLTFSLPFETGRGYIVPMVRAIGQSKDYTNYYFGVSENEVSPIRPAYQPGGAINTELKVRFGYALTEKWLLSGSAGIEFLDSAITNSPIVDEDSIWSVGVGLAYNADIFQPRDTDGENWDQPRFEFRVGAFSDSIESKIIHGPGDGEDGSEVDLEEILGLPDSDDVLQLDAILRMGNFHQLEMGYFELSRTGTAVLEESIEIGGVEFPAGTTVSSGFDTQILRFGYAYTLMKDRQKELGLMAGVHYSTFDSRVSAAETGQNVRSDAETPLPVIGVHGLLALGAKMRLGAKIQVFRLEFDRYEGSLNYLTLDLQHPVSEHFSLGVSYTYYKMKLDSKNEALRGSLEVTHRGPALFLTAAF
jgi:outer membrane scaffolding protein for murein synthesis (MipA/OmpV family)